MVEIEKAVEISRKGLGRIMPQFSHLDPEVAEFDFAQQTSTWEVTFRAKNPRPTGQEDASQAFYAPFIEKVAVVSASDGQLLSIRNPRF